MGIEPSGLQVKYRLSVSPVTHYTGVYIIYYIPEEKPSRLKHSS